MTWFKSHNLFCNSNQSDWSKLLMVAASKPTSMVHILRLFSPKLLVYWWHWDCVSWWVVKIMKSILKLSWLEPHELNVPHFGRMLAVWTIYGCGISTFWLKLLFKRSNSQSDYTFNGKDITENTFCKYYKNAAINKIKDMIK